MSSMKAPKAGSLLFVDVGDVVLPERLHRDSANFISDVLKDAGSTSYLEVVTRATHSGQLIPGRCYTGWGMDAGHKSWFSKDSGGTASFDKPVLVNHDMLSAPLGRVKKATYTKLKHGKAFEDDWINPDTGTDLGSGYITLTKHISDPETMQMVIDGRLKTVSTQQSADSAWCSYCRTPLSTGCDHEIGSTVEDDDGNSYPVYAVTGKLEYHEVSFVNRPRQQNAMTLSFKKLSDSLREKDMIVDSQISMAYQALRFGSRESLADLLSDALPSTSRITKKVKVSGGKLIMGAPKGPSVPEGIKKIESLESKDVSDAVIPTRPESFNYPLAKLCSLLASDMDLSDGYRETIWLYGITEQEAGHAHTFSIGIDIAGKLIKGTTGMTGQGSYPVEHHHDVWSKFTEVPSSEVSGRTRDSTAGDAHSHDFYISMSGGSDSADKLIASGDEISSSLKSLKDVADGDLLTDAEKNKSYASLEDLLKDDALWSESFGKEVLRVLPRIKNSPAKFSLISKLIDTGAIKVEPMPLNEAVEKAINLLNDSLVATRAEVTEMKAKLAEAETKLAAALKDAEDARKTASDLKVVSDSANAQLGKICKAVSLLTDGKEVDFSKIEGEVVSADSFEKVSTALAALPSKLKMTAKSLVSEARKDGGVAALEDGTNKSNKKPSAEASKPKLNNKSLESLDALSS